MLASNEDRRHSAKTLFDLFNSFHDNHLIRCIELLRDFIQNHQLRFLNVSSRQSQALLLTLSELCLGGDVEDLIDAVWVSINELNRIRHRKSLDDLLLTRIRLT